MINIQNSAGCTDIINCRKNPTVNGEQYQSNTGIFLEHIYVANTTLVKLSIGELRIRTSRNEVLVCTGECLVLIEKNQTLSIHCNDIDNHLDFKVIDISYDLISKMYSIFIFGNRQENMHKGLSTCMLSAPLQPGMSEAFENIFGCLQKKERCECGECTSCQTGDESSPLEFTLMFLLSAFTSSEQGIGILSRTVKLSLREKIFNIINDNPSRIWCLEDMATNLYMSRSTLKRKLATEGASFSEVYLDARMSRAAKLLRTGDYNINQVSVMCGYNHASYFITTFRKYFKMTPYSFMKLANH